MGIRREDTLTAARFMVASVLAMRRMLSAMITVQSLITTMRRTLFNAHRPRAKAEVEHAPEH